MVTRDFSGYEVAKVLVNTERNLSSQVPQNQSESVLPYVVGSIRLYIWRR